MPQAGSIPVSGPILPVKSTDTYPTHDNRLGIGGFHDNLTAAITSDRKRAGMWVYDRTTGKVWVLQNDLTTWVENTLNPSYLVPVADNAARDAIPANYRVAGMWAFVISTQICYVLDNDLTTWRATRPTRRYRSMYIDAGGMASCLTNGASTWTDQIGTDPNFKTVDSYLFGAALVAVEWKMAFPAEWDLGPIKLRYHFSVSPGGATSFQPAVIWGTKAVAVGEGQNYSTLAWGTEASAYYTGSPAPAFLSLVKSEALTVGGSPAEGKLVFFKTELGPGGFQGSDVRLFGISVQWRELPTDAPAW